MRNGKYDSLDAEVSKMDCAFCNRDDISYIFKETANFLLAADHAPLVEGHLLIIPKQHYTCYGDVPAAMDDELFALKHEVQQFFTRFYAPAVFWEHGIFRQTVFHAHLHCFPWGAAGYEFSEGLHNVVIDSQEAIRKWYLSQGHYFYMEDRSAALLFAPETERYLGIVKSVFWRGITSSGGRAEWRSPQQRFEEGVPLIRAVMEKWQSFQDGAGYVNETSTR